MPAKPPPPISTGTAAALLVIYTLIYVVPFYLSSTTRPSRTLSRDAPSVIRARITSVSLTCVVCSLITFVILTSHGRATNGEALRSMGYWPLGLAETGRSLLLTAILFSGPLYETLLVDGAWRQWLSLYPVTSLFSKWTRWRNLVAGPFTEEVLFRSASVPLMLVAQTSVARTIFLSPVIFGLAHFHHFYEFRVTHPHEPVVTGLLRALLQLSYTSLFGAYATFLFLRTGSLLVIFIVHAFCNIMGLPRLWGRVEPSYDMDDAESNEGEHGGRAGAKRTRPSILWSVIYYVLLVAGAIGWWRNLGVLTASTNALVNMKI
ncbi:CaaX protease [Xylaria bambusicola]|uniref:CaaX protease n=1 Tax=Xylaria bambusicola TaxID=326684 RepID=UPI002007785A|nr:CaaX protease [Xylaria bambusicola]KAI0526355.1 CaaX protease [Xylaria bambusicola]